MRRMGMYEVGDRVRVTNLIVNPRSWRVNIGDVFTVEKVDSDGDLYVTSLETKNCLLIKSEVEKVEEDKYVYKVGDKVKVTKLLGMDSFENIRVGDVHTVTIIRSKSSVGIRIGSNNEYPLIHYQIEKVEEEVKVKKFRVRDKVKVLVEGSFGSKAEKGRIYTIETVDYDDNIIELEELPARNQWVFMDDVELVNKTSFTFPEMAQKLIDGDFEVGTELVADGDSYFVDRLFDGRYGLSPSKSSYEVSVKLGATSMNSTWTVKEEPVKEMSIEELQKELGYKIKITE